MTEHTPGKRPGLGTLAIHAGRDLNETHAHAMPVYLSSTYRFDDVAQGQAVFGGEQPGYVYGRWGNPNTQAAADIIAALEGANLPEAPFGLLTGSGMAAVSTVLVALLQSGDVVISQDAHYSATYTLLTEQMPRRGVSHDTFKAEDLASLEAALARHERVKLVYIETPVNPTMALADIRGVVERAHSAGALVVIDNTFASPYLQRPLELGVDVVLHSTTKYLGGHGVIVGGAIVTPHADLYFSDLQPALIEYGGVASPMEAWLLQLGLKTFHVRMARHCQNARTIAAFLDSHPAVSRVNYPGLASFPQHELAKAQMDDFGAMMSFELKGGLAAGVKMMNAVRLCTLAVSLGTVDTLINHPASMTHGKVPPEARAQMGISDGLVRLSVGIEDVDDLTGDLAQALDAAS